MSVEISVHLNDDAHRALVQIEATGMSRSDAIRDALLMFARRARRREPLREELRSLAEDQVDREEMRESAGFMEMMRAEG